MEQILERKNKICKNQVRVSTDRDVFHICCWLYLIAFTILPDWFGFRLVLLFSAKRIMLLVCYCFILFNNRRINLLWQDIKELKLFNLIIALYMFVRLYTAVYRLDLNTFFGEFLDGVLVFYLFVYMLKHEITAEKLLRFLLVVLVILCIEGIIEYVTGVNLFSYLNTSGEFATGGNIRNGNNRIQANCHHAIHYGIYISVLFFLSCIDVKKNRLYLFHHPILFALSTVSILLCGSRAPLGIYLLCVVLVCLFSKKDELIKSVIALLCALSVFALFTIIVYNTDIGRFIMLSLTSMIDGVFDTTFSYEFGGTIDLTWSAEYRDALAQVFQLDYFSPLIGRGISYHLSVVIDGYWLQSCDNSYVMEYIQLAYPGLIMLIAFGLTLLVVCLRGMFKIKQKIFAGIFIAALCYFINIWYVAQMGTFMYIWMMFAMAIVVYNQYKKENNLNASRSNKE